MKVLTDTSLRPYNTFGLDPLAHRLTLLEEAADIPEVFEKKEGALLIGGGSNILLTKPTYEEVIVNKITGITITEENGDSVLIQVGSGTEWHQVVRWAVSRNFGGIENLSLIPGTAGAAPIQNIGAYGAEIKDVLHGVDYYHFQDRRMRFLAAEDCRFGYRDSIFKNELQGQGFISYIYLRLSKPPHTIQNTYRALSDYLLKNGIPNPDIQEISEAVIAIRRSKLPDWKELGNAGSFFKNPVVGISAFRALREIRPGIPHFPAGENHIKIPAAWLIQEAGFKGQRRGLAGSYHLQPLVLVNYGASTADDLLQLKSEIQEKVEATFGIRLIPEVTIL